jgi:hypothetical protein
MISSHKRGRNEKGVKQGVVPFISYSFYIFLWSFLVGTNSPAAGLLSTAQAQIPAM